MHWLTNRPLEDTLRSVNEGPGQKSMACYVNQMSFFNGCRNVDTVVSHYIIITDYAALSEEIIFTGIAFDSSFINGIVCYREHEQRQGI